MLDHVSQGRGEEKMKNKLYSKGLVFGIIISLIGAGTLDVVAAKKIETTPINNPSTEIIYEKSTSQAASGAPKYYNSLIDAMINIQWDSQIAQYSTFSIQSVFLRRNNPYKIHLSITPADAFAYMWQRIEGTFRIDVYDTQGHSININQQTFLVYFNETGQHQYYHQYFSVDKDWNLRIGIDTITATMQVSWTRYSWNLTTHKWELAHPPFGTIVKTSTGKTVVL